ncbi:hypothetical protein RB2372 [Rhodopirellula baltica SH 1]|uniref:Uncharacterized protein n=1 Tax=Rhodopirellula baltica (strain DSM 10527 / NCIMB 13988 / SH1) TaxID=243090 RepID=Q7UVY1_RHOBA|nr:hypothetical protein RB2372 [Rhodopirellula baltica SH 1]
MSFFANCSVGFSRTLGVDWLPRKRLERLVESNHASTKRGRMQCVASTLVVGSIRPGVS